MNRREMRRKAKMCSSCWCPSVIQAVIEHPPLPSYLLAVDNSKDTMEDIVEVCVANDRRAVSIFEKMLLDTLRSCHMCGGVSPSGRCRCARTWEDPEEAD